MSDNPQASFDLSVVVETDKALANLRALHAEALALDADLQKLKKDAVDAANNAGVSIGAGGRNVGKAQIGGYQNVANMFGGQNLGTTASAIPQLAQAIGQVIAREMAVVKGASGGGTASSAQDIGAQLQAAIQNASPAGGATGASTSAGADAHTQLLADALDTTRLTLSQLQAAVAANTQVQQQAAQNAPTPIPSAQSQASGGAATTGAVPAPPLPPPVLPAQPVPAPTPTQAASTPSTHAGQPSGPTRAPTSTRGSSGASGSSGPSAPTPPPPTPAPSSGGGGLGGFMQGLQRAVTPQRVSGFVRAGAAGPAALATHAGGSLIDAVLPLLMDNPIGALVAGTAAVAGGAALGVSAQQGENRMGAEALAFNAAGSGTSAIGNTTDAQYQQYFRAQQIGQNFNFDNATAQKAALQMGLAGQTGGEILGQNGNGNLANAMALTRVSGGAVTLDQASSLTSTLAVQGGDSSTQINRIFQDITNGSKAAGLSVGRMAQTFADFTDATNGAALSVSGLMAVQQLMGRGVNAAQVMSPIANATGMSAFSTAAQLGVSTDTLKNWQVHGNMPAEYDALSGFAKRYQGSGGTANEDVTIAALQQTGLVDMSKMSAKNQYKFVEDLWNNKPGEAQKLAASIGGKTAGQAQSPADNLLHTAQATEAQTSPADRALIAAANALSRAAEMLMNAGRVPGATPGTHGAPGTPGAAGATPDLASLLKGLGLPDLSGLLRGIGIPGDLKSLNLPIPARYLNPLSPGFNPEKAGQAAGQDLMRHLAANGGLTWSGINTDLNELMHLGPSGGNPTEIGTQLGQKARQWVGTTAGDLSRGGGALLHGVGATIGGAGSAVGHFLNQEATDLGSSGVVKAAQEAATRIGQAFAAAMQVGVDAGRLGQQVGSGIGHAFQVATTAGADALHLGEQVGSEVGLGLHDAVRTTADAVHLGEQLANALRNAILGGWDALTKAIGTSITTATHDWTAFTDAITTTIGHIGQAWGAWGAAIVDFLKNPLGGFHAPSTTTTTTTTPPYQAPPTLPVVGDTAAAGDAARGWGGNDTTGGGSLTVTPTGGGKAQALTSTERLMAPSFQGGSNPLTPELYAQYAAASKKYGVPLSELLVQGSSESSFNPNARSSAGAQGIAQFMPSTLAGLNKKWGSHYDINKPADAIMAQARWDKENFNQTGSWAKAMELYNPGDPTYGSNMDNTALQIHGELVVHDAAGNVVGTVAIDPQRVPVGNNHQKGPKPPAHTRQVPKAHQTKTVQPGSAVAGNPLHRW